MPETETPAPQRGRGRPKNVIVPAPAMDMDPKVKEMAAATALDAGEPREDVGKRLHLKPDVLDKIEARNAKAPPRVGRKATMQEIVLSREVDGKTLERVVFLAVQGHGFQKINKDLAQKNLYRLTPTQYSMICNLPQVLAAKDALMMIGLERGIGNKMKRIQTLSDLAGGVATRLKAELKKPDKPDVALVKTLLAEYREYSKEVSIETGERVENFNIDALVRGMSPRQLLELAEVNEGEIIEGDFGENEPGEDGQDDQGEDETGAGEAPMERADTDDDAE